MDNYFVIINSITVQENSTQVYRIVRKFPQQSDLTI